MTKKYLPVRGNVSEFEKLLELVNENELLSGDIRFASNGLKLDLDGRVTRVPAIPSNCHVVVWKAGTLICIDLFGSKTGASASLCSLNW